MNTVSTYSTATELLEEGRAKDAYAAFLSVVELSTQQLYGVKFVHQTLVSKPIEFEDSITLLKSSVDHLHKIATTLNSHVQNKLPGAVSTTLTTSTAASHQSSNHHVKPPPPVPPKPYHISQQPHRPLAAVPKPDPPPKPLASVSNVKPAAVSKFAKLEHDSQKKRSRGNSVSFAEDSKLCKSRVIEHNDDRQWDNNRTSSKQRVETCSEEPKNITATEFSRVGVQHSPAASWYQPQQHQIRPVVSKSSSLLQSSTSSLNKGAPLSLQNRSKSWIVPSSSSGRNRSNSGSNGNSKSNSFMDDEDDADDGPIDVLLDTIVDPRNLMPAQTSTGDSLTLPTLSAETDRNSSSSDNYVPNIPAPPLLATHRRIQQRINALETKVQHNTYASQKSQRLKCAQRTLEKVRSLYMSAMTIPSIMHLPPHLVAYQLTLIESSIFRTIPPEALLTHSARTPHKKIVASTDFFNYTTRFIEHSILLPQEAYRRAEIIHRWIKIAAKLYLLHNYQTLKAVVSALGTPPIKRLRRTWDCIPKKKMARLDMLSHLMSETDNYQKYREHMQLEQNTCNNRLSGSTVQTTTASYASTASTFPSAYWIKPVVPFLGVFIHDVTYLNAAAKKENEGPQQNRRLLEVLDQLQVFQKAPAYPPYPTIDENNNTVTMLKGKKKKNLFRPMDALHFVGGNSSRKDHNNTGSTIFGAATAALMLGDDERMEPQQEIEVEQQLITQYLLMRPWVNERTIDALSNLREPVNKPRSISSPTSSRYNTISISNDDFIHNGTLRTGGNVPSTSTTAPAPPPRQSSVTSSPSFAHQTSATPSSTSSIFSSASSMIRLANSDSHDMSTSGDSNSSSGDFGGSINKRSLVGQLWPFRKSNDINRQANELHFASAVGSRRDFVIANSWSEVDDDDEDEDEDDEDSVNDKEYKDAMDEPMTTPSTSPDDKNGFLSMRLRFPSVANRNSNDMNSTNTHSKRHSRSLSLPS